MQEPETILSPPDAVPGSRSLNGPTPFLSQPRAHSALRHELDALAAELAAALAPLRDPRRVDAPERPFDLHVLPHRFIARMDDVAVSFSWIAGRTSNLEDGRLLVIAWRGVETELRGAPALRSATPVHESSYRPEGDAPERWRWDPADAAGVACTTSALVAEWIGRASTLSSA